MSGITLNPEQSAQLQAEIQRELERREWAEPEDNVMAEYITVLLANGSAKDRVQTEMDDLVGSDFDPAFLDWLFSTAKQITSVPVLNSAPAPVASTSPAPVASQSPTDNTRGQGGSRLLNTALAPLSGQPQVQAEKRKASSMDNQDSQNKKRNSDIGISAPSGPRGMGMGNEGKSLADRLGSGPMNGNVRGRGVPIRGSAGGRGGNMGMGGHMGFRPNFQQQQNQQNQQNQQKQQPGFVQPGFGQPFMPQGQQEMVAQMMMMQASMAQMNNMVATMMQERQQQQQQMQIQQQQQQSSATTVKPARPPPVKVPHGTKLGAHSVSGIPPKSAATPEPIPDKPSSVVLCRFSVGCSNSRCIYSHPSPVADEKTGMVLSEEPCENGKNCKDAECIKSHVSPAATLGESAGPSRLLCKYQNCTNPSCPFRHEDENGNPIPPPALTASKILKPKITPVPIAAPSSDNEDDGGDGDVEVVMTHKGLMDGALEDNSQKEVSCRYGERCTRPDCKFSHPSTRPTPKFGKKTFSAPTRSTFNKSITSTNGGGLGGGMNMSKKFGSAPVPGAENKLDPTVGEFKPATGAEKELEVTY